MTRMRGRRRMMPRVLARRSATLCHRHGNCVRFLPELARVRSRSCHAQASSDVSGFVGHMLCKRWCHRTFAILHGSLFLMLGFSGVHF